MENLQIAKSKIENGAKFNGVVYGKNNGKNWTNLFVYLDGSYFNLGSVNQKVAKLIKAQYEKELNISFSLKQTSLPTSATLDKFIAFSCDTEKSKAIADFHAFCEGVD